MYPRCIFRGISCTGCIGFDVRHYIALADTHIAQGAPTKRAFPVLCVVDVRKNIPQKMIGVLTDWKM